MLYKSIINLSIISPMVWVYLTYLILQNLFNYVLCSCVTIDTFLGFSWVEFSICHVLSDQSVNRL